MIRLYIRQMPSEENSSFSPERAFASGKEGWESNRDPRGYPYLSTNSATDAKEVVDQLLAKEASIEVTEHLKIPCDMIPEGCISMRKSRYEPGEVREFTHPFKMWNSVITIEPTSGSSAIMDKDDDHISVILRCDSFKTFIEFVDENRLPSALRTPLEVN